MPKLVKYAIESLQENKRWIIIGAILYLIPVFYRLTTGNSFVPILDSTLFLYYRDSQITPVNLEILGALFLIPGSLGAVIGASFLEKVFNRRFAGLEKYLARVLSSLTFGLAFTAIQFFGFLFLNPAGPLGSGLWSAPDAYARNLLVAIIVAPLVPYVFEFVYNFYKIAKR